MQIMSKLLEEVLSKKNMILVYKSTSRVDNVANDEIKDKLKQGLIWNRMDSGVREENYLKFFAT